MEDRIILIDKPAGISSFGAVAKVRTKLRNEFGHKVKVGHTGTLDPFATGLLILLSGKMTKKSSEFLKLDKEYLATLKLGYTSTTGDPEGEITEYDTWAGDGPGGGPPKLLANFGGGEGPAGPAQQDIKFVVDNFIGKINQTVPKYSAIKINGQRAYKLARQGKNFETPTREITIYNMELLDYHYPELTIKVHCSSGTYIRTLAEDIGKKLGTGAYLTSLRRTKIGSYSINDQNVITL